MTSVTLLDETMGTKSETESHPQMEVEVETSSTEPGARLQILLAMFKSRNMELVEENNRLRSELEAAKQNLMLSQTSGNDAELIKRVLEEMTQLTLGSTDLGLHEMGSGAGLQSALGPKVVVMANTGLDSVTTTPQERQKFKEFKDALEMPDLPSTVVPPIMQQSTTTQVVPCLYSA